MKIMCVISGMTNGGAERVMSVLTNYFILENDVRLVLLKSDKSDYDLSQKIDIRAGKIKGKNIIKSILFVKKNMIDYQPDIVLSFMTNGNIVTLLANKALNRKFKVIISERANPYKVKGITSFLRKRTYSMADGCVFQTDWSKEYYKKMIRCKSEVIYNPLSPDFKVKPYHGTRKKTIVCTARLYEVKNQKLLINAFDLIKDKYPNYKLEIYGEGPEKERLQKQIDKLSLNNQVKLMGRRKDIIDCIKSASLFVLPSNSEGMSNALLEAMSLGLPCISTDSPIGGSAVLIDNNVNGILIPMEDVNIMAESIEKIINDPKFANRISKEAMKVKEKFETEKICKEWENYFITIAKG